MNNSAPILVLGASGFIGSQVIDALLHQTSEKNIIALSHRKKITNASIQLIEGNLESFDWNNLNENPPSHIFHLARINSSRFGKLGRKWAAYKGKKANQRLLKHIKNAGWKSKVSYVSGSLMYGNSSTEIDEDNPLNPLSFAKEYIKAEKPFLHTEIPVQMLRLPWVFGNASWFKSFYLEPMLSEKAIPCYGDGKNIMSFIEVSDAANAIAFAGLNLEPGTYNLAIDEYLNQKQFCDLLSKFSGLELAKPMSNQELNQKYESAIAEAFTSNIQLVSKNKNKFPKDLIIHRSIEKMIELELGLFLKDK